jgi:hypothetical protein
MSESISASLIDLLKEGAYFNPSTVFEGITNINEIVGVSFSFSKHHFFTIASPPTTFTVFLRF